MNKRGMDVRSTRWIWMLVVAGLTWFPATTVIGQPETETAPPAAAESDNSAEKPAEASTDTAAQPPAETETEPVTEPAETATPETGSDAAINEASPPSRESSLPAGKSEPSAAGKVLGDESAEEEAAGSAAASGESSGIGLRTVLLALTLVGVFIVPMALGNYLSRIWRMPDYAWKFTLILGLLIASILICLFGQFKFGPDLAGGITLVYELADASSVAAQSDAAKAAGPASTQAGMQDEMDKMIATLKMRLDPDGTKEIAIRRYGPAIEVIIPKTGADELEYVKRRITDLGSLEFRITADNSRPEDRTIIEQAKRLPPSQKELRIGGNKVAEWVAYDEREFGPVENEARVPKRMAGDTAEALLLMDPWSVTGDYLTSTTKGLDNRGGPAVLFSFNSEGARLFRQLTGQNKPNPATPDAYRNLGIILDKRLISAPRIESTISDHGMISGGGMDQKEVEHIVEILDAGSLPAALNKTPISEHIISPTLGKVTVEKGTTAIVGSLIAVILFMLIYYRFAGFVACLALTFNLLLVLALMVLLKAALTLPGLAGLVLTIGMSVDANVLIYERIREEMRSGAALRMAIRNGFSRAMNAIIDSNVTTIIAGVVLFYIGTDQVKGFAVTLILGIITSMFTAIFFARVVFDVAERRGWIKHLRMMKVFAIPNYDFLGVRWIAGGASIVLILVGLVAVYFRGKDMLDIDFRGGSSVTFTLHQADSMPINDVRDVLMTTELADKNLLIVELGTTGTRYSIDSNEQSVDAVKKILADNFGDRMMRYSLEFSDLKPFTEGEFSGTEATLKVNSGPDYGPDDGVSNAALSEWLGRFLAAAGHEGIKPALSNPNYRTGSSARFKNWTVRLTGLDEAATRSVLEKLKEDMQRTPLFPMANAIGGRVSADMQTKALLAIGVSLLGVIAYLWLRFQKVSYGLAAGVALVHDVLVTLGMMALSAYIVQKAPAIASFLKIDAFQINLTIVAAFLTIIGYSLNDTIVTFDRLREIKGKSPSLTPEMVNSSVNQTLSRTILTATTVFLVVVILYIFGGEGIHSFAFAFLVGVLAGTYSTVYIAAPVLLFLSGTKIEAAKPESPRLAATAR